MWPTWLSEHTQGFDPQPITHGRSDSRVFRLVQPIGPERFVKIVGNNDLAHLKREVKRLRWLHNKFPVPEVINFVSHGQETALIMSVIPGEPLIAYNNASTADREHLAKQLGKSLREFHSLDITNNDFLHSSAGGEPAPDGLNDSEKSQWLKRLHAQFGKPSWKVFLHGDPSLPNVIAYRGEITGFVDVGAAGVGDPFRDIALALWSLEHNYGPGFESALLEGYAGD